jgi:hypothetical protein
MLRYFFAHGQAALQAYFFLQRPQGDTVVVTVINHPESVLTPPNRVPVVTFGTLSLAHATILSRLTAKRTEGNARALYT